MKRIIAIAALPALLGGCLPLPVTIASTAISGLSYLTTGKTSSDHVLSAAVEQDCIMARPIFGESMCRDIDPNSPQASERVVVAAYPGDRDDGSFRSSNDPDVRLGAMRYDDLPESGIQVAVALPFAAPVRDPIETPGLRMDGDQPVALTAAPVPTPRPAIQPEATTVPAVRVSAPIDSWTRPGATVQTASAMGTAVLQKAVVDQSLGRDDGRYVVIGSLRDSDRAEALAVRFEDLRPQIRSVELQGTTWNRVVVGPYSTEQARHVKADLGVIDGREPWIVQLRPEAEQIAMR
ncbi:MAG: SPOR domain-containing protein [Alphaproteobacteria bacterium]|nr:SPOR domain-containing protein [Alphaproteobacteria bacterium]